MNIEHNHICTYVIVLIKFFFFLKRKLSNFDLHRTIMRKKSKHKLVAHIQHNPSLNHD